MIDTQVALGQLTEAEADAGLVIVRVINEDLISVAGDDSQYDEAFAKRAADYSAAAYYDGSPADALNYKANNQDFKLGTKVTKPYAGGDISAYTGIDKTNNLSTYMLVHGSRFCSVLFCSVFLLSCTSVSIRIHELICFFVCLL
jgi:hypothetical protein